MNDFNNERSQIGVDASISRRRYVYPTWKSLIKGYIVEARKRNPEVFSESSRNLNEIFPPLDLVRKVASDREPSSLVHFLHNSTAHYNPRIALEEVMESFKRVSVRQNEFYAIFDFKQFSYCDVDKRITEILGIPPQDFNLAAMAGFDPSNPLFHHRDYNHLLRWSALTYYMLTINLFKWNSMEDQYRVKFRIGTSKSSISHYRDEEYATLEKLCFLYCDKVEDGESRPIYHFDKWLVFNKSEFDCVKPKWLSVPAREAHLNNFNYLIHAYLLDISAHHLLLLHLRQFHDRNKAIASAMNEMVYEATGIRMNVDEHQIGDCFAKTLRGKMSNLMNEWDKRGASDLEQIVSDAQAVEIAKTLGLLPIPDRLLTAILSSIT